MTKLKTFDKVLEALVRIHFEWVLIQGMIRCDTREDELSFGAKYCPLEIIGFDKNPGAILSLRIPIFSVAVPELVAHVAGLADSSSYRNAHREDADKLLMACGLEVGQ